MEGILDPLLSESEGGSSRTSLHSGDYFIRGKHAGVYGYSIALIRTVLYHFREMATIVKTTNIKKVIEIVAIIIFILVLLWFEYQYLPLGVDWIRWFRPATLEFLAGRSPYTVEGYFNPPWLLIPLIPFAILPVKISSLLLIDIGLICYIFILYKLRIRPILGLLFLLFPTTLLVLHTINLEWLVMLGFLFPPQIGLFFVLIKPQVGVAMAIYWLIVSPQKIKTFLPVVLAFLISFAIYEDWLPKLVMRGNKTGYFGTFDVSFFPYLVPLGLALLVVAIRKHKDGFAYMASPFLSPYVGAISYTVVLLGICKIWSEHLNALPKVKGRET